jgi:uncharacterized membrane protein YqhA
MDPGILREIVEAPPVTPEPSAPPPRERPPDPITRRAPGALAIAYTRYMVLLAVWSLLLVALAVWVLGAFATFATLWAALQLSVRGELVGHEPALAALNLVVIMLEAVVFYLVGIGLYHLFISPIAIAARLGIDTLDQLEGRIVGVIAVLIGVIFLEHLVEEHEPMNVLVYSAALALTLPPLVWLKSKLH